MQGVSKSMWMASIRTRGYSVGSAQAATAGAGGGGEGAAAARAAEVRVWAAVARAAVAAEMLRSTTMPHRDHRVIERPSAQ